MKKEYLTPIAVPVPLGMEQCLCSSNKDFGSEEGQFDPNSD